MSVINISKEIIKEGIDGNKLHSYHVKIVYMLL